MDCQDYRDQMLELLYGEASEAARGAVREHHARCLECRQEYEALRALRSDLAAWKLPAPEKTLRPRSWQPLAVAASLLLAVGTAAVALAGAELRREGSGWTLRVGVPPAAPAAATTEPQGPPRPLVEQRAARQTAAGETQAVLEQVEALIEQSERRQRQRLELALAALSDRTEAQRRYDLAQVSAGLSYLEGKAGLHAARTTELMGQVLMAAQEGQEK